MTFPARDESGVTVVALDGDIDVARAPDLRNQLAELVAGDGAVLLDLSTVRFIDSSGVGVLVTAHRKAAAAGVPFALAGAGAGVRRVFELTRTDRLLRIFGTVEEGLQALRSA